MTDYLADKRKKGLREGDEDELGLAATKSGAFADRSCTDLLWLVIYLVFQAAMCYIAYYACTKGDPNRVMHPYDPDRNEYFHII